MEVTVKSISVPDYKLYVHFSANYTWLHSNQLFQEISELLSVEVKQNLLQTRNANEK